MPHWTVEFHMYLSFVKYSIKKSTSLQCILIHLENPTTEQQKLYTPTSGHLTAPIVFPITNFWQTTQTSSCFCLPTFDKMQTHHVWNVCTCTCMLSLALIDLLIISQCCAFNRVHAVLHETRHQRKIIASLVGILHYKDYIHAYTVGIIGCELGFGLKSEVVISC